MRRLRTFAMATAAVAVMGFAYVGLTGSAVSTARAGDADVASPLKVDDFRLTDQNLHSHELRRMSDAKAIVLITQQDGCPVSRNIGASVKALQTEFAGKGVEFMMLNSTPSDKREDIQAEAASYGYDLPILMDRNQLVGEQLGVTRTAEAIVIDPKTWKIVYRGPVDDRVTYERQKAKAEHTWTKDALNAMLAGQPVAVSQQEPVGCLIDFPNRGKLVQSKISYVKDVAPIVEAKCAECHEKGGIGPMPLTSYEQIKAAAPMIREVLRTQRMPPWRADPTIGHFLDDKSLSSDQIKTLVHWVEAGSPRGEGPDPLGAKTFVAKEWPLGKPDLILDVPAYSIPATGVVDYQRPWVAYPEAQGRWLRASTIKVENRQAVHHILTGYITEAPKPGAAANESSWGASAGGYAVGAESEVQPNDTGTYLPAGGAIGFQNHYTPFGKAVTEHSKIGLYFYKDTPKLVMHNSVVVDPNIQIPPNTESWEQHAYLTFPKDALLYAAFPHAHYRGASSQLWLQTPDGNKSLLLALPNYDFNWQRDYNFATPINVPAGSKLIAIYTYDNSQRNPANPDHNRTVPWGDQSSDEMLYTAVRYRWVGETSDKMNDFDVALNGTHLMGMLDTNMDGKLTMDELSAAHIDVAKIKANFALIDAGHKGYLDQADFNRIGMMMGHRHRDEAQAKSGPAPAPQAKATVTAPAAATAPKTGIQ